MNKQNDTWGFLAQCGLESTRIPRIIVLSMILVLLLLVAYHSDAQNAPTGTSTPSLATPGTEWLFDAALGADMLQTLDLHRAGLTESNPLLGVHPNQSTTVGYFVGAGVIHYLLTRELIRQHVSTSLLQAWEAGTIGIEMAYVKRNASLGVRFYFP